MRYLPAIILVITLTQCIDVPVPEQKNYVVEGYVYANQNITDISVLDLVLLSDPEGTPEPISTAEVNINYNGLAYKLEYNPSTKKYQYPGNDLLITSNDFLELSVRVDDRDAISSTTVPTKPVGLTLSKNEMIIPEINSAADFIGSNPLEDAELVLTWDNPENELFYTVIEFKSNLLRPILPSDIQEVVDGILEDFAIVTTPSTDTSLTILGATLPSYGPYLVTVYKVNQEYADLYSSDAQDSRELTAPPGNMVNAQGIFTAFASDSLSFTVVKP